MEQFSNSDLSVTVEKKPASRVELTVKAGPNFVQAARKKAIRIIAKEVSLPGFRKGKAPDEIVLKNYPAQVDKEWKSQIASLTYPETLKLTHIHPLNQETKVSFDIKNHSAEGAELVLVYEVEPELPLIDPKQITLKSVKRPEVNEDKVKETIRQTMLFFAEWEPVIDRPIEQGDYILLDVDNIEQEVPDRVFANTRFEVSEKSMAEWMRDAVVGLHLNESRDAVSVPDKDLSEAEKAEFKPQKVRLTLKAIHKPTIPELDDAFAQKLGADSVEHLHVRINELLNQQADDHVQEALREQINDYLLNQVMFDLPPSLIQKETEFRFRQLLADTDFQESWNKMTDPERKKLVANVHAQSEKAVRMFYICRKILADAQIRVSPNDLPAPPRTPIEAIVRPQQIYNNHQEPEVHQAELFSRVLLEKAQDYLISQSGAVA